ncbi:hypothetical protein P280DRAFT_549632 [Massarina eburnea CBS 473.64]|uniref:C2H2-type domain-containing protein n=1 Tax=Massarina eburnea CBS 473.64 TaxID=1395130 RepID=A0A6A6RZ65_9PLEO|nr:hypothetical protein P280DRAFT_549632 [Massarina eburnea CBS 473.64]
MFPPLNWGTKASRNAFWIGCPQTCCHWERLHTWRVHRKVDQSITIHTGLRNFGRFCGRWMIKKLPSYVHNQRDFKPHLERVFRHSPHLHPLFRSLLVSNSLLNRVAAALSLMPCKVECRDINYSWYCCRCGDGPLNCKIYPVCANCNHERCQLETSAITLPDLPPPQLPTYATSFSRVSPELASPSLTFPSGPFSVATLDPHENHSGSDDEALALHQPDCDATKQCDPAADLKLAQSETVHSLNADVCSTTETIDDSQLLSCPTTISSGTSTHRTCPSGQNTTNHNRGQAPKERSANPRKQSHARAGRRRSKINVNGPDSGDQGPQRPKRRNKGQTEDPDSPQFACPFLKHNPHRHRHVISCRGGYARLADLKHHLTRKISPHTFLHECDICVQIFADKDALDAHKSNEQTCARKSLEPPAEGIGETLRRLIKGSPVPLSQGKLWWDEVYKLLFGHNVEVPSCYYDERDITESNDPGRQVHYRHRLEKTLQRGLPEAIEDKIVLYHLQSAVEAEAEQIHSLFSTRHNSVIRATGAMINRRRSNIANRTGKPNPSAVVNTIAGKPDDEEPEDSDTSPDMVSESQRDGGQVSLQIEPEHDHQPNHDMIGYAPTNILPEMMPFNALLLNNAHFNDPYLSDPYDSGHMTRYENTPYNDASFIPPMGYDMDIRFVPISDHPMGNFSESVVDHNLFMPTMSTPESIDPLQPSAQFASTDPVFDPFPSGVADSDPFPSDNEEFRRYCTADLDTVSRDQAAYQSLGPNVLSPIGPMNPWYVPSQTNESEEPLEDLGLVGPMTDAQVDRYIGGNALF